MSSLKQALGRSGAALRAGSAALGRPLGEAGRQRPAAAAAAAGSEQASDAAGRSSFSVAAEEAPFGTLGTQAGSTPEAVPVQEAPQQPRSKLLVIGGNGFVGSAICKEALSSGREVLGLSRSGAPLIKESWIHQVDWIRGSVFDTHIWKDKLKDVSAVISCVGGFGSNDAMRKINGEANVVAVNTAADEGVKRFVFISAHDVGLPPFILRGYFEGKKAAEEAVRMKFPYSGVILRPAMIHGTRQVGNVAVPLSIVGAPLEMVLRKAKWATNLPLIGPALVPPVKVTSVAKAAVRAATDNAIPPGALDVWGILKHGDR
eukprot:SM000194S04829  [mRNA]  locus=s194:214809:217815:- [translate_table: standard]